jgi:opacity protein-like surface antigen
MRRWISLIALVGLTLAAAATALAQDVPKVEIPVGFSMINAHPNQPAITSFNLFGGGGQIDFNIGNVFGIKADFMGYTQSSGLNKQLLDLGYTASASGNMFTYMFGPQIKKHSGRFQPFAEALFGAAHTNLYTNIANAEGAVSGNNDNNGFAMALGGGIDYKVSRHFSIRPVEADYMMTRFTVNRLNGHTANQNNFRYFGGAVFTFGGTPPVPPTAACTVSPTTEILAGAPITATISTQNFNPKHTVTYRWESTGGKISSTSETGTVDTADLAPGSYTVSATATDEKQKKYNVASCNATFTVRAPRPPTIACSASPESLNAGDQATVTSEANSPDGLPLTYSYSASEGQISGTGTTATLATTGAPAGPITVTCNTADDKGQTASATTTVTVQAPPPPPAPQVKQLCSASFERDKRRPARVDNDAKGCLDDIALNLQQQPDATAVLVGEASADEKNAGTLAAQRAVNEKDYLVKEKGIDASRISIRTGSQGTKEVENYLVPSGANFEQDVQGTSPVDESTVSVQPR